MDRVVVSWNVAGLHAGADERAEAQCLAVLLSEPMPHVVALQEVVRRTWFGHWRPHLAAAGFRVAGDPTATDSEYFCVLAVRGPLEVVAWPFAPSRMGRRCTVARSGGWTFATAHLESERAGADLRIAQAAAVAGALRAEPGPAAFVGDTNLRAEEEARVDGLGEVTDAWVAAGRPAAAAVTWRGGRASARFDRVWCNGAAGVAAVDTLPTDPALSDHAALRARLVTPS